MTSSLLAARTGSRTPRVSNYPPYELSAASEVIDLAKTCGLRLDPWQQDILTHGLGLHPDGRYTANRISTWVPRQNGKGAIIEALSLAWLFLTEEEEIVHSAHEHRTAKKAYIRLEKLIRRSPDLFRRVRQFRRTNGEQMVELHDGRLLEFVTRSKTAVRGFSAKKVIWDEAQEVTQDQMAAVGPTTSAQYNWQHWFFGTPPSSPDAWAYNLRDDGEAGVPRLAHFDWGLALNPEDRDIVAKTADRGLWYAANPAAGIRISEETMEDEHRPSGLGNSFAAERLGCWKPRAAGGGVIDPAHWAILKDLESKRAGDVALWVDVTPMRDHATIGMVGPSTLGAELMHAVVVDHRPGTEWVPARLAELRDALRPVAIGLDAKNGAYSLLPELKVLGMVEPEDPERPARGDLIVSGAQDVAVAVGQIIDAARHSTLRHHAQQPLDAAIVNAKLRPIGDGGAVGWGRKISEVDIGPLMCITGARWAYLTREPLVRNDYDPVANFW